MPTGRGKKKTVASELELENLGAPIEVRRHPAARRLTLRVSKTKRAVIVTVPAEYRMDEAGRFLRNNIDWVRERLGSVPEPVPFADGARIPLRGALHRISFHRPAARQRRWSRSRMPMAACRASTCPAGSSMRRAG